MLQWGKMLLKSNRRQSIWFPKRSEPELPCRRCRTKHRLWLPPRCQLHDDDQSWPQLSLCKRCRVLCSSQDQMRLDHHTPNCSKQNGNSKIKRNRSNKTRKLLDCPSTPCY